MMCRFALHILLASSCTIAAFSSPDSLPLDTFDEELSSSGPIDSGSGTPEVDGLFPIRGSGDIITSYQDQEFITEDTVQGLACTFDLGNRLVTVPTTAELFGSDLLPLAAQYQSDSPADKSCDYMTDSQTAGAPALSWSNPDPDLVQRRAPALFCPVPPTAVGKKKLRPNEQIEPNIRRGEPDDSRNYGGPNVRLRVPGGGEDDMKRCASQKRTLCCKGPANLPRVVRNCWHYDVANKVCDDYRNIYCCRRTDFRYRTRMLNRIFDGAGFGYVCTYLFQIYNPKPPKALEPPSS